MLFAEVALTGEAVAQALHQLRTVLVAGSTWGRVSARYLAGLACLSPGRHVVARSHPVKIGSLCVHLGHPGIDLCQACCGIA